MYIYFWSAHLIYSSFTVWYPVCLQTVLPLHSCKYKKLFRLEVNHSDFGKLFSTQLYRNQTKGVQLQKT